MSLFDPESLFSPKKKESTYSTLRFPVRSPTAFCATDNCQTLLNTLRSILLLIHYHDLYYPAVEQFIRYVQGLPAKQQGLFSEVSGLLEYSLARATYTLTLCLAHFYPNQKDFTKLGATSYDALKLYAAFTASLFLNLEQLINYYEISLYNKEGQFIEIWKPFERPLETQGVHAYSFKYTPDSKTYYLSRGCLASLVLNRHISTQKGFYWMAQHPEILESWLGATDNEEGGMPLNVVMELIPFADKKAIDERLQLLKTISHRATGLFYETSTHSVMGDSKILGEQFLQWLREGVASGRLSINARSEEGIRRTESGILISREELIRFSQLNEVNAAIVEQQFRDVVALYPASVNERARQSSAMGGVNQVALGQWLLVYNPALIFSLGRVPPFFSSTLATGLNSNLNPLNAGR